MSEGIESDSLERRALEQVPHSAFHEPGVRTLRIHPADYCTHARSDQERRDKAFTFKGLQHSDVSQAPCPAPPKNQSERGQTRMWLHHTHRVVERGV